MKDKNKKKKEQLMTSETSVKYYKNEEVKEVTVKIKIPKCFNVRESHSGSITQSLTKVVYNAIRMLQRD